jgi:hypothetical protein
VAERAGAPCHRVCRRPPFDALRSGFLGGESGHGEAAVCGLRQGVLAAFTSSGSDVLRLIGLSARAPATLATGQAAERCRLPREPGAGAAGVGSRPSRLLAGVSAHASPVQREQSPCGARAATRAARGAVCKDGRVKGAFVRPFRDLSARAGECRRVCKDGRVDCGNDFDINSLRGSGGSLQREDLIGAGGLSC